MNQYVLLIQQPRIFRSTGHISTTDFIVADLYNETDQKIKVSRM